ncbi:hypothetical protein Asi03nite_35650 [Actinoplanes siamensis]|uniref:Uncharacterized protein n=1 Tax=Actinoplanes siamensis TaxID=1223317 RepID=A0A919N7T3_9ACTN|nr:hypothetical protein Asi03nite_35650 [Actinoplanes siamensis]
MAGVVAFWAAVLAGLSWWSVRGDPATVPEQRDVGQAMPALRRASGTLLAAAGSAASGSGGLGNVGSGSATPDSAAPNGTMSGGATPHSAVPNGASALGAASNGAAAGSERWVVRLGELRSETCQLTPIRAGVNTFREVFLYVPQGRALDAFDQVAAALPREYRAGVVSARVGTKLSLFADAGDFIAIEARARMDDQVLTLSARTGCRPGSPDPGSDPAAGAPPATLAGTVAALGGRADAEVSTLAVACPGGGTAATYQAIAGPSGDGPRGLPDGTTPVWSGADGWAYRQGPESVVVAAGGENLLVSVTRPCGQ